ncbi:MAG TPA: hypothetical protein VHV55_15055 [Pirellulales bacterium]|nr:hypothetical protein [Pirellulales bacterium]
MNLHAVNHFKFSMDCAAAWHPLFSPVGNRVKPLRGCYLMGVSAAPDGHLSEVGPIAQFFAAYPDGKMPPADAGYGMTATAATTHGRQTLGPEVGGV